MSDEMGAAAMAASGALKSDTSGETSKFTHCQNCGTELEGQFCHVCGQLNDDFHRPFWKLLKEGASDMLALDSRAARTIPALLFRPGRVTKRYIDGERARFVPPFRLYLLTSVLFFFIFFSIAPSEDEFADFVNRGDQDTVELVENAGEPVDPSLEAPPDEAAPDAEPDSPPASISAQPLGVDDVIEALNETEEARTIEALIRERFEQFQEEPRRFWMLVQSWTPRLSLILVPLTILGLVLVYPFKKNVYLYDHIIASLHFHTFLFIAMAIVTVSPASMRGWMTTVYVFGSLAYFYRMLLVVYEGSWWLTAMRAISLWVLSWLVVLPLAAAVMALAFFS